MMIILFIASVPRDGKNVLNWIEFSLFAHQTY